MHLTKKAKIAISIVCAVIAVIIVSSSIYCVSTNQTPAQAFKTAFTSNDKQIVGKWQSEKNPGLSAYVFYDDNTYDSYISTANFSGTYEVSGNKLTLKNPNTSKEIIYRFSVNEKELTLTLYQEDGKKVEDKEVSKYEKVEELNQKSLTDLIGELKEDSSETTTENN